MTLYRLSYTHHPGSKLDVDVLTGTRAELLLHPQDGPEDNPEVTGHGTEALLRAAAAYVWGHGDGTVYDSEEEMAADGFTRDTAVLWEDVEWYELEPRKRSGTRVTEAEYREAGLCRLNTRVTTETRDALRELAERRGESQASVLTGLIREAAGK